MQLNYIANAFVPSSSGRTIPVIDPSDGQTFDELQRRTVDGDGVTRDSYGCGEQVAHDLIEEEARSLGLKIENKRALERCEESLAVPGIAFAEWGPGDMGMSLGFPDNHDEPYPAPLAAIKALALFADFWLGWPLRARPFVRRGGWVLLERGWWDLAVDPRRYRLRPGGRLVRVLGRLLPQSDVLLVLEGPPDALRARKQELPEAELERQVRAWHDVVPAGVRRVHLDTSASLDEVLRRAEAEVLAVAG